MNKQIEDNDLPALYRAADKSSVAAQKRYINLIKINLALLVIAALLESISTPIQRFSSMSSTLTLLTLFLSVLLTSIISYQKPEQEWFGGRVVAESVKSLTWRYITGAEPFDINIDPPDCDRKFAAILHEILEQRKYLCWEPGGSVSSEPQITDKMRLIRSSSIADKKDIYINERINNQMNWYSTKAQVNKHARDLWFGVVILTQLAAFLFTLFIIFKPGFHYKLTGVFTSLAAAFLAWMEVKRHQELTQSYAITAHELGIIQAQVAYINDENEFSSFVADAESAMSREHTLWAARRDNI